MPESPPPEDLVAGEDEVLATGWEVDAADDDTAVRQFLLAMADRLSTEADALGTAHRWDEAAVVVDTASPALFENAVLLRRPPDAAAPLDELAGIVDEATRLFPADRAWSLLSPFPLPDLRALGLRPVGHPPFMLRAAGIPRRRRARPVELRLVEVGDEAALREWDGVARAGFGLGDGPPALDRCALGTGLRLFLGRVDGDPVAAAAAWSSRGITEVTWVATLEHARGRGYGEAVTWEATLAEPALPAGLIASDAGQPIYRRMGYLPVVRFTLWAGPPPNR